jgi:7-carboxy-7-deazaguanine synthase
MEKSYTINEIFYSIQGEGRRAGTANHFLRFSACNATCSKESHGFDCDTEFVSGRKLTISAIIQEFKTLGPQCDWVILTGGEPALQVDKPLIDALHEAGYRLAIETNGSISLPEGIDWITVSPKVAEHAIRQRTANELKYVRAYGQELPKSVVKAEFQFISPAFDADGIDPRTLAWCIDLVKRNPAWSLSMQQHKAWKIR